MNNYFIIKQERKNWSYSKGERSWWFGTNLGIFSILSLTFILYTYIMDFWNEQEWLVDELFFIKIIDNYLHREFIIFWQQFEKEFIICIDHSLLIHHSEKLECWFIPFICYHRNNVFVRKIKYLQFSTLLMIQKRS